MLVLGDEAGRLIRPLRRDVVVRGGWARDEVLAERSDLALEAGHDLMERRVVDRGRRRLHDEEDRVVALAAARLELLVDQVLRANGLRVIRERDVLAEGVAEQCGGDGAHRDDQHDPHSERAPRVTTARPGDRFGAQPHLRSPFLVDRTDRSTVAKTYSVCLRCTAVSEIRGKTSTESTAADGDRRKRSQDEGATVT